MKSSGEVEYGKKQAASLVHKGLSLLMALLFIFSLMMSGTLALESMVQHKSNALAGTGAAAQFAVQLNKYEKSPDGTITTYGVKDAEFYLYRCGTTDIQIGGRYLTDLNGRIIVQELSPGEYYFLETAPAYGFVFDQEAGKEITRYPFVIDQNSDTVIVTAYNRRQTGSLCISKTVQNADGSVLTPVQIERAFAFMVTFSDQGTYTYWIEDRNGEVGLEQQLSSGEMLFLKHGERAVFSNLPVGLVYHIQETPDPEYVLSSSMPTGTITPEESEAVFVNLYDPGTLPSEKLVLRKVVRGEVPQEHQQKEFWFTVTIDGESVTFPLKDGEEREFILPANAVYSVKEMDYTAEGYQGAQWISKKDELIEVVQTNTYINPVTISISGQKKWDKNGHSVPLPESIIVKLKRGDIVVDRTVVKPDHNGNWLFDFTVPKYDEAGNRIRYTVEEEPIEGWKSTAEGFVITNQYLIPVLWDTVQVKKRITGDVPKQDAEFHFRMTAKNNAPMPEDSVNGLKRISVTGEGTASFGKIRFTAPGKYIYTISEINDALPGYTYDLNSYTVTVTVAERQGKLAVISQVLMLSGKEQQQSMAVFTNRYQKVIAPSKEKAIISGYKIWNHRDNDISNYPKSIVIYVKNGNQILIKKQITAREHWYWSFTLDKYDPQGNLIQYTIEEVPVSGYETQIDGYNLINTYTGEDWERPDHGGGNESEKPSETRDKSSTVFWMFSMMVSGSLFITLLVTKNRKRYVPKYLTKK